MKGASHPRNDVSLNPSSRPSIGDVIDRVDTTRRRLIQGGVAAVALASVGGMTPAGRRGTAQAATVPSRLPGIGFASVPANRTPVADRVQVPAGYTVQVLVAWGDPILPGGAPFTGTAHETAADQLRQFGMHNDGMHFFPNDPGRRSSERGILCVNNEYTQEELLYADGRVGAGYTLAKTRKSQAAHGVSIVELRRQRGKWLVDRHSSLARRLTANTPMCLSGPAAGHALLQTREFRIAEAASVPTGGTSDGRVVHGTLGNCANGSTPWGTYLTCEENWNVYFGGSGPVDTSTATEIGKLNRRYGVSAASSGYRWHTTDARWDASTNPNEPHLFGWVVEIDPYDPQSIPVKRTALGRFKHESAQPVVDSHDRVAFYMGDDERNEYIYKFVCRGEFRKDRPAANRHLLDEGTLYVARFDADLTGLWLPLTPEAIGLDGRALRDHPDFRGANDAEVQAKILIKTRMAADALGATMMDRAERTAARPRINGFKEVEVYCALTNNGRRGAATSSINAADGSTAAGSARPPVDAANPREDNIHGHIIRWREAKQSVRATTFTWDLFVQAGDSATGKAARPSNDYRGNIIDTPDGSADYAAPDGLWFDDSGRLWVQTDHVGDSTGDVVNIGSNMMLCVDPGSGETRRFLTSPPRSEVTGMTMTPNGRTLFVGIQHPGEGAGAADPTQHSSWPQSQFATESDGVTPLPPGRPRSSVLVITKDDGGIIGT